MDPATAIVIGTLEPSPLVWRWARRAISAGAAAPATGDDVLVMLAGRTGSYRDATVLRRPAGSVPRTGCAAVPSARPDRGLSARATFARTGPPALVLVGGRDVCGQEPVR